MDKKPSDLHIRATSFPPDVWQFLKEQSNMTATVIQALQDLMRKQKKQKGKAKS